MIVFDLSCDSGHVFEAWFKDGATYDRQRRKRQVNCAVCGSTKVAKAPMAPRIAKGAKEPAGAAAGASVAVANDPTAAKAAELVHELERLRRHVEENCEHVGERFADEARAMHYGEKEKKNIYGSASDAEAQTLAEEGVEFARVPWLPRRDS